MGKDVLKSPGLVLEHPSAPSAPWALLLVVALIGIAAAEPPQQRINMARTPHTSHKWNISQTEYETKHREYFDLVEQNQRRRLNSSANYDEENIVRKKLFTFTHSGLKNSPHPPSAITYLNYEVHIPEESNKRTEVEVTSLRLLIVPRNCATRAEVLTLEVGKAGGGGPIKRETLRLEGCLPKWVGVDLSEGLDAKPNAAYALFIRCEECLRRGVRLEEPHLNVIVNVRARLRRRRAERKKRKRFPGKCVRHPWEVDLNKLKGYEYIVQPRKFDAGLCAGKCTGQWNLATQHSNLQYLFSNIDKSIPKPCCAPSKMEGLEILYPDEDNPKKLKVSVWNDTKIVECACS